MRILTRALAALLLIAPTLAAAEEGLVTLASTHGVERTMNRLERAVRSAGFRVFARIDHSRAADRVNIRLRPTQLLIFGKPEAGSVLMQSQQSVGIDLPLKYLVWRDAQGRVQIGWNDPAWLMRRHHIGDHAALTQKMSKTLERFASEAAGL